MKSANANAPPGSICPVAGNRSGRFRSSTGAAQHGWLSLGWNQPEPAPAVGPALIRPASLRN